MHQRLVVGTDGSTTAEEAVRHARSVARATGARVHLVTAWSRVPALVLSGAGMTATGPADDGAWITELHRQVLAEAEGYGVRVEPHVVEAAPAAALVQVVDAVRADLLVVGNRGMALLRGRLGSVASSVAHKAHSAVLVVPTS